MEEGAIIDGAGDAAEQFPDLVAGEGLGGGADAGLEFPVVLVDDVIGDLFPVGPCPHREDIAHGRGEADTHRFRESRRSGKIADTHHFSTDSQKG